MLFRVWCKDKNEWEKDEVRIDECGNQYHRKTVLHDWMYVRPDNHIIEFNTGITLADGTETFFGDIVKVTDTNWGYGGKYDKTHDRYKYIVITKDSLSDMVSYLLCDGDVWHDDVKLIGNIHETELTDVMKVWIK